MRYSTKARFRKYLREYGFLSFARKCSNKYGKKLMDNATKTGTHTAKTASKRVFQKNAEATANLTENKIEQIINDLRLF